MDYGFVMGCIKLGMEFSGGFKNIVIINCIFECCCGFVLEIVDGGKLEDIVISNIMMCDIVNVFIFLWLGVWMCSL